MSDHEWVLIDTPGSQAMWWCKRCGMQTKTNMELIHEDSRKPLNEQTNPHEFLKREPCPNEASFMVCPCFYSRIGICEYINGTKWVPFDKSKDNECHSRDISRIERKI